MFLLRNIARLFVSGLAVVSILAGCAAAPKKPDLIPHSDYSYTREYLSWLIRKEMKRHDVTGLSIALVDDQKVVWAEGFGYADLANKVATTPETVYRVGSISKLFTATAAMQPRSASGSRRGTSLPSATPDYPRRSGRGGWGPTQLPSGSPG